MRYVLILTLILISGSPHAQVARDIEPFMSLAGMWKMETPKGSIVEEWQRNDRSSLKGRSYRISPHGDTTLLERISIRAEAKAVFYIPAVSDQNNARPVKFRLVRAEANKWFFENKEHDFPQQIVYWLKSNDELLAWIEGQKDGKYSKREFLYVRVK